MSLSPQLLSLLRLLIGRLLLFALAATAIVLLCQLPVLTTYVTASDRTVTMSLHPDRYWTQVSGFWQRVMSSPALQESVLSGWWRSLVVLAVGLGIGLLLGTLVGVASSFAAGGRWRPLLLSSTFFTMALPDFIVVLLAQRLVVYLYREYDFKLFPILSDMHPLGWMLPGLVLGLFPAAYMARIVAIALDDILREDYIRTARAKGLHNMRVLYGHALRNALPRMAAATPQSAAFAVSALLIVEYLTNWLGLGFRVLLGGLGARSPLEAADQVTLAALAWMATYLIVDALTRLLAALLGARSQPSEAEGMV